MNERTFALGASMWTKRGGGGEREKTEDTDSNTEETRSWGGGKVTDGEKASKRERAMENQREEIRVTELDQADERVQGERTGTRAEWGFQRLFQVLETWMQHRNKKQDGKFLLSHWYNV
ncbi:hypothetical protein QQF64_011951, partial [Cirrhinus molitorella]